MHACIHTHSSYLASYYVTEPAKTGLIYTFNYVHLAGDLNKGSFIVNSSLKGPPFLLFLITT